MMLNPVKCAFGVGFGKFLGLMVSKRGIEANPDKIKGDPRHGTTKICERCSETNRKGGGPWKIHI